LESKNQKLALAPFVELVALPLSLSKNIAFDIIIESEVTLENYCNALIDKLFDLTQSEFPCFINYQCDQVKESLIWLNKLEKLIANNEEIFTSRMALSRYNKLFNLIEHKRKEMQSISLRELKINTPKRLINAEAEDRHFSFHEVKEHIEILENFGKKILFLTEEIFEYRQAEIISINHKLQTYDQQCNFLIEKLQTVRKMRLDLEKEQQEHMLNLNTNKAQAIKIQLNGPINIVTNAFKQMMNNVKPNGTAYISYKIIEIAQFICENFVDENGQPLSQATIQTYLSPNRTDKDPNNDSKVRL
jgi:hypothetical protein